MSRSGTAVVLAALACAVVPTEARGDKKLDEAIAKADAQLLSKTPDEAEKTLQKLVPQGGPEACVALARVQLQLGKEDEAGQSLEKALATLATASPAVKCQVHTARAEHRLIAGAHQDALASAKEAVKAEPSARALAALARAQARAGDPEALATAERAVAASAASSQAQAAKGEALLQARQWTQAEAAFREAVRLDARFAAAGSGLALALSEQGKHTDAVAEAKKALDLDGHSADAEAALADVLLKENPQKNWKDAISHAQNGVFENPKSARGLVTVGRLFEIIGNETQAQLEYDKALAVDSQLPPARLSKLRLQMRHDPKNAAACALAADLPSLGEAQAMCATAKLAANDVVGAIPYLEKAVVLSPDLAEAQYNLGRAYFLINQAPRAVAPCKQAVALAPKNVELLATCGLIIAKGGDSGSGVKLLVEATKLDPKNAAAWTNLGWAYRNMKPIEATKAVEAYDQALGLDPKSGQAALGKGWALVYAQKLAEAETAFMNAVTIDPQLAGDAYYGIARTWYLRGNMPKAREAANKATAAGRDVTELLKKIAEREKPPIGGKPPRIPPPVVEPDEEGLVELVQILNHGSVGARRKACQDLGRLGVDAVPHLGGALSSQPDISVRQACLDTLCIMGKKAAGAILSMEYVIANPPAVIPTPTDDEIKQEQVYSDFVTKMKGCLRKLKN